MQHVRYKKYTYYLFLGTVVQQMIQRFLESLACTLEKSDQRMSMARILFKSPLNPWSICLLVIAPNIPTTIKFSHREHTCEHCNFCRSTCNCFFFVPFCSFLYLNSLSLSQSRLNWIEMWAQSSESWALFGSLSFQFWQKMSLGEDGQRILNMVFIFSSPEIRL